MFSPRRAGSRASKYSALLSRVSYVSWYISTTAGLNSLLKVPEEQVQGSQPLLTVNQLPVAVVPGLHHHRLQAVGLGPVVVNVV